MNGMPDFESARHELEFYVLRPARFGAATGMDQDVNGLKVSSVTQTLEQ